MKNNKGSSTLIAIFITFLLTVALLSTGFYLWYQYYSPEASVTKNIEEKSEIEELQKKFDDLEKQVKEVQQENKVQEVQEASTSNIFNLETLELGDKVGNMTVKSIGPFSPEFGDMVFDGETSNLKVVFEGELSLEGTYSYCPEGQGLGCENFMINNLSAESLDQIPRLKGDTNKSQFVFSNLEFAKEEFGILGTTSETGDAAFKIDEYVLVRYPSEVGSTANLVEVLSK